MDESLQFGPLEPKPCFDKDLNHNRRQRCPTGPLSTKQSEIGSTSRALIERRSKYDKGQY